MNVTEYITKYQDKDDSFIYTFCIQGKERERGKKQLFIIK